MTPADAARLAEIRDWSPTHRHYKGGLYQYLMLARQTETGETLVIYRDASGLIWARPREMFTERLPDGRMRFEPLPPAIPHGDAAGSPGDLAQGGKR